jgi:hypothetical protein
MTYGCMPLVNYLEPSFYTEMFLWIGHAVDYTHFATFIHTWN